MTAAGRLFAAFSAVFAGKSDFSSDAQKTVSFRCNSGREGAFSAKPGKWRKIYLANLVILESPSKAATVKGYLGSNYKVVASKGHVRDLPKSTLGVDIENSFEPRYINIRGRGDLIKELRREAKKAKKVFLMTDPDREGEAIAWHLANALDIPVEKALRAPINEVTKTAVKAAVKSPRKIDMDLVNAQQTRRILDRIVGYKLSPYLWKSVRSGLSAGRVQSVATRMIVDREESGMPSFRWNTGRSKPILSRLRESRSGRNSGH